MLGMRAPLEKVEQAHICKLVSNLGGKPYVIGTRRRKDDYQGTMQTPGIADLWISLPAREFPTPLPAIVLWWETKRIGGRRTPDQVEFGDRCVAANQPYGWGTCNDFVAWLIEHGRLKADQVAHYRRPAVQATSDREEGSTDGRGRI